MTAIERAEALLEASTGRAVQCTCGKGYHEPECEWLREVAERQTAELEIERLGFTPDALRGCVVVVKALLAEHTLTVDWETNQDGTPIASTLPHYNAFRMGQYTTEDCESCQGLSEWERLFPETPASAD